MNPPVAQENNQPLPTHEMNRQEELKFLAGQLGEFGNYQLFQHILHLVVWLISGIHIMEFVFVFPIMEHRCYIPEIDGHSSSESSVGSYIPTTASGNLASCSKFKVPNLDNTTIPCGDFGYVYSSDYYVSSRVSERDMVCEREGMRALLQSSFLFGALIGAFVGGALSDTFGRKPVLLWSGMLGFISGLCVVFVNNIYVATVFMMLYGCFGSGAANGPSLTLTMELVGTSRRTICGCTLSFAFGTGGIVVAGIAYFLPVNAKLLHLIYVSCSMVLFANYWLLDESISWLWGQERYDEAIQILKKAAKMNGVKLTFPECFRRSSTNLRRRSTIANMELMLKHEKFPRLLDVFRTPQIRKRALVSMFTWFVGGMLYYGLSFNSVIIIIIIHILSAPYTKVVTLIEWPSYPITILLMPKIGYRPLLCVSVLLPGITCVGLAFLPRDIVSTSIAMLAKISANAFYNIANAYTAELFPTVIRNTAIGLCFMATRMGACLIPQINMLNQISTKLPNLVIGVAGIMASVGILLFLPETMNKPIPQTIEDVENYKKKISHEKQVPTNIAEHQEVCDSLI